MNTNIQLELNTEEINLILRALGNLPFSQVYELIAKIHEQANAQMQQKPDK